MSLLKEMQTAIEASEWPRAGERLRVFSVRADAYLSAETALLEPQPSTASPVHRHRWLRLRRQQQHILQRRQRLQAYVSARRAESSCRELAALIRLFAAHGRTGHYLLEALPQSEALLQAFAERLQGLDPEGDNQAQPPWVNAFNGHRLLERTDDDDS
ncbi:hypothetical protein [Salinisphaera sp. LB1]|uniref:hypothetical protein n=1 Tax=Salinisphaera sp. LB1 TaxID=2183911 RepID=UPI0011AB5240|nr:hypothetical protein [Salinisphaera sp. LB1]